MASSIRLAALPVGAAGRLGIPAIGVSNFTWDWILKPWCGPDERHLVDALRSDYAAGTLQLCLPLGPDQSSFPDYKPAPLLARKARLPRDTIRERLELGAAPVALVCLGGWDVDQLPSIHAQTGRFRPTYRAGIWGGTCRPAYPCRTWSPRPTSCSASPATAWHRNA